MTNDKIVHEIAEKQEWVRPELKQLVAGAAESQSGAVADGGGGLQGS